jgi:hypothetical protein
MATMINTSVSQAFVFAFRMVMLICAGLSMASAIVAWLTIPAGQGRHLFARDLGSFVASK